jgi:uncharacterized heparinase superfamily protein
LPNLSRYYHTLKYLKAKQLFYQFWYKASAVIKPYKKCKGFSYFEYIGLPPMHKLLVVSNNKYLGNNTFQFLHIKHAFDDNIDWNFLGHGKLWNYNLQYFDYLHDETLNNQEAEKLISSFIAELNANKVKLEPYPVSLRLINWAYYFGNNMPAAVQQSFNSQLQYLAKNIEYHIQANHLLENYLALAIAGYACNVKAALQLGKNGVEEELKEQILNDGAHYELSPMYHCIILSKLLMLYSIASQKNDAAFANKLLPCVIKMLGWLQSFAFKDATYSLQNDATHNIAPTVQNLLQVATELGIKAEPLLLKESGYRKMQANNIELLFDGCSIMPSYQPGHTHADILNVTLQYNHQPILVDAGISTYNATTARAQERSTSMHNTVNINNQNQFDVWSSFRVGKRADVMWVTDTVNCISAKHNGYYAKYNCWHERTITIKQNSEFEIIDTLTNCKTQATACFHFDYAVHLKLIDNALLINDNLKFSFANANALVIEEYDQALGYNHLTKASKLTIHFFESLTTTIRPC